ncbi:hypothetical protein [Thioalkalivibrio sp. ALE16]|uniref:hypothetical protein n=1 Tax=Thioalkalivibrio sp. ALE16 TaxID=1158172 RepID=UPI0003638EF2|nr:hypothetical protein [Thioalkalivibrio sp. ALE16]
MKDLEQAALDTYTVELSNHVGDVKASLLAEAMDVLDARWRGGGDTSPRDFDVEDKTPSPGLIQAYRSIRGHIEKLDRVLESMYSGPSVLQARQDRIDRMESPHDGFIPAETGGFDEVEAAVRGEGRARGELAHDYLGRNDFRGAYYWGRLFELTAEIPLRVVDRARAHLSESEIGALDDRISGQAIAEGLRPAALQTCHPSLLECVLSTFRGPDNGLEADGRPVPGGLLSEYALYVTDFRDPVQYAAALQNEHCRRFMAHRAERIGRAEDAVFWGVLCDLPLPDSTLHPDEFEDIADTAMGLKWVETNGDFWRGCIHIQAGWVDLKEVNRRLREWEKQESERRAAEFRVADMETRSVPF